MDYNREVDKILNDLIKSNYSCTADLTNKSNIFRHEDLGDVIELISETIYQYHQALSKERLKVLVEFLIASKYRRYYVYDPELPYNKICQDHTTPSIEQPRHSHIEQPYHSYQELISHQYDYEQDQYLEANYLQRQKRIGEIKKMPQYEQKTEEWYRQRQCCLTATAVAVALDEDPYKYPIELLLEKCDRGEPFVENENVHHGKKYEEIGKMFYAFRNNIAIGEYGLLQCQEYPFIGASPDGICEERSPSGNLSRLVGRLLEIKFPKKRKIKDSGRLDGDICPHYYYCQVQTQLFVTGLDECDFLQCEVEEYRSFLEFTEDTHPLIPGLSKKTNLEKGCLIQLLPKKMINVSDTAQCLYHAKYLYPPKLHLTLEETKEWIAEKTMYFHQNELFADYFIDRVIYWRLVKTACHLIKADPSWMESKLPLLKQFWNYVLFYRKNTQKLDSLIEFVKEKGVENSAAIFSRVHKDYLKAHPRTKYQAPYQEESAWRKEYQKKRQIQYSVAPFHTNGTTKNK